jgi:putative NADH-flavin reductase
MHVILERTQNDAADSHTRHNHNVFRVKPGSSSSWEHECARHDALMSQHDALMSRHDALMSRHDALMSRHDALMPQHDALMSQQVERTGKQQLWALGNCQAW